MTEHSAKCIFCEAAADLLPKFATVKVTGVCRLAAVQPPTLSEALTLPLQGPWVIRRSQVQQATDERTELAHELWKAA